MLEEKAQNLIGDVSSLLPLIVKGLNRSRGSWWRPVK